MPNVKSFEASSHANNTSMPFLESYHVSKRPTKSGALQSSSGHNVHLRTYHTFGRADNCHTHLTRSDISRIHAIIFWKDNSWFIEDKSTNGIWVNEHKLIKAQIYPLKENDVIVFSSKTGESFTMINSNEPCDMMVNIQKNYSPIYLQKPMTFISDKCTMHYKNDQWHLIDNQHNLCLQDSEIVNIEGRPYCLQYNHIEYKTVQNRPIAQSLDDLEFRLEVSDDEEEVKLSIHDSIQTSVIEGTRIQSQLYLMLCLARKSIDDRSQGYAENNQGWINLNDLSKELGIEPDNARIRLHRLRTRLRDSISFSGFDACQLVQLKDGEVRLNASKIIIKKGNKQEANIGCH
ncbi:FHA domain-containing protein [Marinomonas algicola]|uniref:FHA domain-containing protein n=1 Tax=Marinomonas algicola TaxID=2773454 RepID=UPI00174D25E6|nr:FHA domain-containing protein [Marinomonas algicola]